MLPSIARLKEISRCCRNGEPLDAETSEWLGESLQSFLDRRCPTLEDALGLQFARGGVPWWQEAAIRSRNAAIRELADFLQDFPSTTSKSRAIRTLSIRYAASAWRFDKHREAMPDHYPGTANECLWKAFKSGAAMPISERHIRSIIG